jgi:hypothetical protein
MKGVIVKVHRFGQVLFEELDEVLLPKISYGLAG